MSYCHMFAFIIVTRVSQITKSLPFDIIILVLLLLLYYPTTKIEKLYWITLSHGSVRRPSVRHHCACYKNHILLLNKDFIQTWLTCSSIKNAVCRTYAALSVSFEGQSHI